MGIDSLDSLDSLDDMYHMSNEAERSETYMTYRTIETDSPVNWTVIRRPNNRNEVLSSKLDSTGVTNKTNGIYGRVYDPPIWVFV